MSWQPCRTSVMRTRHWPWSWWGLAKPTCSEAGPLALTQRSGRKCWVLSVAAVMPTREELPRTLGTRGGSSGSLRAA